MKIITNIIRILVGALFIFSGFVKAIDPLGTSYKMHEYFEAFAPLGLKSFWEWMNSLSTPFAVFMIVIEMGAGLALLMGWKPKFTAWILFLMTLFFTVLTGFTYLSGFCPSAPFAIHSLAIIVMLMVAAAKFNSPKGKRIFWITLILTISYLGLLKSSMYFHCEFTESKMKVTDCGCFGDFMKLKPWQTFYKDIVLDVLIFILVIGVKHIKPLVKPRANNFIVFGGTVASLLFCFSNYVWGLPIVDFRPYKIGTNIPEAMKLPPDAKQEIRKITFQYKKDGKEIAVSADSIKYLDSTFIYVGRNPDVIVQEGDHPKIHDFTINGEDGSNYADEILSNPEYSFMLVSYNINKSDSDVQSKVNELADACAKIGIQFFGITGSSAKDIDDFRHKHNSMYDYYSCDETALKTVIRSNPGLVMLKKGTVINMWHYKHFPSFDELKSKYDLKKAGGN